MREGHTANEERMRENDDGEKRWGGRRRLLLLTTKMLEEERIDIRYHHLCVLLYIPWLQQHHHHLVSSWFSHSFIQIIFLCLMAFLQSWWWRASVRCFQKDFVGTPKHLFFMWTHERWWWCCNQEMISDRNCDFIFLFCRKRIKINQEERERERWMMMMWHERREFNFPSILSASINSSFSFFHLIKFASLSIFSWYSIE